VRWKIGRRASGAGGIQDRTAVQVVGVNIVENRRRGIDLVDDADRHVAEPDIFAQGIAVRVGLQHDMAEFVVAIVGRSGGAGDIADRALHEP
jgi:hypothetical protein